jgi:glycerol-3-phosphate dehydrogenase
MLIGDGWREISLFAARIGKNRDLGTDKLKQLGDMILNCADVEEKFFRKLSKTV